MHFAKKYKFQVLEIIPAAPAVLRIRFEASKRFDFAPGQFLSMIIPPGERSETPLKRCYSFSCSPEEAREGVYEICVRLVPGGVGSYYLAKLRPGDSFEAFAPFGDFCYRPVEPDRSVCLIATGTGVAPFRSMVYSDAFLSAPPKQALCIMGVRTEKELLYRAHFEAVGVNAVYAVSNGSGEWTGFKGRVTDYLHSLPRDWNWHSTDYYICGNGQMVADVTAILRNGHGVSPAAIHRECFTPATKLARPAPQIAEAPSLARSRRKRIFGIPFPMIKPT